MNNYYCLNLKKIREHGIEISMGRRQRTGPLLKLSGLRDISRGLSNLILLAMFVEIEIVGILGALSTFITTESLLKYPQVIVGFSAVYGFPILIGATEALKYHAALIGMTQGGKSTLLSLIIFQLSRLGFPVILFSMKSLDASLLASLWDACNAKTRVGDDGEPTTAPFQIYTLEPGMRTRGLNVMPTIRSNVHSESAFRSILHRGLTEGGSERDPRRRFFSTFEFAMLRKIPELGNSLLELENRFSEMDQTQEEKRFGASLLSEVSQLASIEQANLPEDHPANIEMLSVLKRGGVIYVDACFQDAGASGTANAALVLLTIVQLKRRHMPSRDFIIYVPIDESQKFNQEILKQQIEQMAGYGIRFILCYHNLEQLGENQETLGMTQVKFIFNAVPGGDTDRYIQNLHGTKTDYLFNHGLSEGTGSNTSYSVSSGPSGTTFTHGTGTNRSQQTSCGFSETEKLVWPPNSTLHLNGDPNLFLLSVNPGSECACFGNTPILCNRGGFHLTWEEVKEMSDAALNSDPHAFIPGAPRARQVAAPALSSDLEEKRMRWSSILSNNADKIRAKLS